MKKTAYVKDNIVKFMGINNAGYYRNKFLEESKCLPKLALQVVVDDKLRYQQ